MALTKAAILTIEAGRARIGVKKSGGIDMTKTGKIIRVVGAAIIQDGQVLCLQRGQEMSLAGLWEFPGGKLEAGETEAQALAREIKEELTLEIEVSDWVTTAEYAYEFATIQLAVYKAKILSGSLTLLEHQASRWVKPQDLMSLDWAPVDIPAAQLLAQEGSSL